MPADGRRSKADYDDHERRTVRGKKRLEPPVARVLHSSSAPIAKTEKKTRSLRH
jgi:hypothetical protein